MHDTSQFTGLHAEHHKAVSRTGTFRWPQTTAQSLPLTAIEVKPAEVMALNAYSTWYSLPSGEKTVKYRSKLERDMVAQASCGLRGAASALRSEDDAGRAALG